MDIFNKKLSFSFQTNQQIIQLIGFIDGFRGTWKAIEQNENRRLKELKKIATIESIGSSTRIEGSVLTDNEIRKLIAGLKISKLKTRDEQEVAGYFELLEQILESYSEIQISENHIKQLHQILLKYSTKDERHRGNYKSLSNQVAATYPDGTKKIIFKTTEPHLVEIEMRTLLEWTDMQFKKSEIHPLIVCAFFVYEFLSIHPFQDGNGRLSRILSTLMLLKSDYHFVQYISFENIIEQRKKEYFEALMQGQKNRNSNEEIIDNWVLFFLGSIKMVIEKLGRKYDLLKSQDTYLNIRQKKVFDFISKNQPVRLMDISLKFVEISINTIKKDIQFLKNEQLIESAGKNKGTFYIVKKEKQKAT